jgi:DNA-binding NarL/FixJ family response regulator
VRALARIERLGAVLPEPRTPTPGAGTLTEREAEVLRLISEGLTNVAIAHRLGYSVSTIRNDTIAIYRKLGVTNRSEAAALGISRGLV